MERHLNPYALTAPYNPFGRDVGWIAVFQCFFDDSGDQHSSVSRYVVVAGYMAHQTMWDSINGWWRDRLLHHGISNLHMRDLWNVQKRKGWTDQKRTEVVKDFMQVIREAKLTGIGCAIDSEAFLTLPKEQKNIFGNAYDFGMTRVLRVITERIIECKFQDPVTCVFDQDVNNSVQRLRRYFEIRKSHRWLKKHFASITFADSDQTYGLQMADVLAWEVRRQLIRKIEGNSPSDRYRRLMTPLPGQLPDYHFEGWDKSTFESQFTKMQSRLATDPDSSYDFLPDEGE